MKNLGYIIVGGALALLVGCHAAPDQATAVATPVAGRAPVMAKDSHAVERAVGLPFTGYRRFRGTVGGQPVTVELTIGPREDSRDSATVCEGRYFYDRHPAGQLLLHGARPYHPQQPVLLAEADAAHPGQPTGRWQASQPVGPLLTGTWTSPAGQQLPFSLHEDYTDGQGHVAVVQYELLQEGVEVPCQPEREAGESKAAYRARTKGRTSSCNRFFVHLLGPDTLRPALRTLQCPVPARRQQQMREEVEVTGCTQLEHQLAVSYNEHGLLSVASFDNEDYEGAVHPAHGAGTTTYDLRTGRPLAIAALIRPGTDSILSRLITQHLAQDEEVMYDELLNHFVTDSTLAPLPRQGLGIADEGLGFTYTTYEILPYVHPPVTLVVPWRELLPLLRPDSPVARMLRERGLWQLRKSR
ncbi:hypothetical protein GO988_04430 [Hymenobacter sp. HMF4947]|uniref:DUF3298 domain-containing protein n=1 Tax=Hymenobacter ginkgonis TaxID=2682976 RepID=A0A7K1TAY2_9BACT|nr:RsiV family protein [Hymenobacter ginkgonis]MVN75566.1 hypothetical protein [Hymenobacter ginkgonis]